MLIVLLLGGLKLWEGSLDLVKTVYSEVEKGRLVLKGKRVLEVGCFFSGDILHPFVVWT